MASFGYGGQTLYLIPELDVIIVFTCKILGLKIAPFELGTLCGFLELFFSRYVFR